MAIQPKPFSRAESIKKTIYKGRPAVYTVQDINRETDAITDFGDVMNHGSGVYRTNIGVTLTNVQVIPLVAPDSYRITHQFQLIKTNSGLPSYFHSKGVSIPFTGASFTGYTDFTGKYNEVQVLMFAQLQRKTFASAPTLCGVTSDVTSPQESCELDVYGTPIFVLSLASNAAAAIAANSAYDYLGVVCSIVRSERVVGGVITPYATFFFDAADVSHLPNDKSGSASWSVFANVRNSLRSLVIKILDKVEYLISATDYTLNTGLPGKVDKVTGMGLSTNDYTTIEKSKLAGIANNANNYVHPATHSIAEVVSLQAALDARALVGDVLLKTNSLAFTPTGNYNPATKLFVETHFPKLLFAGYFPASGGSITKRGGTWSCTITKVRTGGYRINHDYYATPYMVIPVAIADATSSQEQAANIYSKGFSSFEINVRDDDGPSDNELGVEFIVLAI